MEPMLKVTDLAVSYGHVEALRGINKVAYVRFASVYREFTDISSFTQEIARLLEENKEAHLGGK